MNRLNKTKSSIFVSLMCSLLPKDLHSEGIVALLQRVLCRVAAVKRLPVYIVQIIYFLVLWDNWAHSESV